MNCGDGRNKSYYLKNDRLTESVAVETGGIKALSNTHRRSVPAIFSLFLEGGGHYPPGKTDKFYRFIKTLIFDIKIVA
jgi:hypothetical protein